MRWVLFVMMAAGVAGFTAIVLLTGVGSILQGLHAVGWGIAVVVLIRTAAVSTAGIAWRAILGKDAALSMPVYVGLRLIREAVNAMLPVAQVGGDLIGGRLLAQMGETPALAGASILIDLLLQAGTQALFAAFGLAALWAIGGAGETIRGLTVSLLLGIPALLGFFLAQRLGLLAVLDRGAILMQRRFPNRRFWRPLDLQAALHRLYRGRLALLVAAIIHLLAWTIGVGEIWVALSRLGLAPTGRECLVLESLGQAVRSISFAVPGAFGIQEGGYILLGSLFGLPLSTAVTLSIVKRLPDLIIGIPGLCAWQLIEGTRLRYRPAPRRPPAS